MQDDAAITTTPRSPGPSRALRIAIGVLLLSILPIAWLAGVTPNSVFELLRDSRSEWSAWLTDHLVLAALGYAVFYMVAVSISLPGALWFTLGAGFLFPVMIAVPVALFGITAGAANAWLGMRFIAGPHLRQRFSGRLAGFAAGFARNEFAYVTLLRILPLPFFLVNLAAALIGRRFLPYVAGTLAGSLPSVILYANLGSGVGDLVEAGVRPGWSDLARPEFLIATGMVLVLIVIASLHRRWAHGSSIDVLPQNRP
jgi:uncharacterized membrane protein YdjX (TVP38/TMEM64 family)